MFEGEKKIILTILWITAKFLKFLECKLIWGFPQKKVSSNDQSRDGVCRTEDYAASGQRRTRYLD